jgi:hypothetical protein
MQGETNAPPAGAPIAATRDRWFFSARDFHKFSGASLLR